MNNVRFDEDLWRQSLAGSLVELSQVQEPFLQKYWATHNYPTRISFNDKDETPFPSDDLLAVYNGARYSAHFGTAEYFAPLTAALNPVRGILRDHPIISRAQGREIPCDEVQVKILNSASLTSHYQLIVGQMSQNPMSTKTGFLRTASELDTLLSAPKPDIGPLRTGALDVGMDIALYYGIRVTKEVDLGEGYSLIPLREIEDYVDREWLREVAPEHVDRRRLEGMFAIAHKFFWHPQIRHKRTHSDFGCRMPPALFHRWAEEFANLLAVLMGNRISRIMTLEGCISNVASELLGQRHRSAAHHKGHSISHLYCGFTELNEADDEYLFEAKSLFSRRSETAYAELASVVSRFAEALSREGRFANEDRILDIAIVFERMFKPTEHGVSQSLQSKAADLLCDNEKDKERIRAEVRHLYNVRSAIIHNPSNSKKRQLLRELETAWKEGASIARASLIKKLA